jgi:hypothetical protein
LSFKVDREWSLALSERFDELVSDCLQEDGMSSSSTTVTGTSGFVASIVTNSAIAVRCPLFCASLLQVAWAVQ